MDFDSKEKIQPSTRRAPQVRPPSSSVSPHRNHIPQQAAPQKQTPRPSAAAPKETPGAVRRSKDAITAFVKKHDSKKARIAVGVVAVVIICGIITLSINSQSGEKPQYATVLPTGKSINSLGGWKRVTPPNAAPAYAYNDTLDGVSILVSQQPLPENITSSPDEGLKKIADSFNAKDRISGTSAYIGTSAKGPQSVLVIKKGTLVLIKSEKNIAPDSWAQYIQSLK